jgi:tRNA (adenine57-N1/adenine58-N1)-methyltransferase catalytic subunit
MNIKKILISHKTHQKYYVKRLSEEYITTEGIVSSTDIQSSKGTVITDKKKSLGMFEPSFLDFWETFERGPQIIQLKDIGLIVSKTGIAKDWNVVDAGAGTGSLCLALAKLCKKITAYDIKQKHLDIVKKNATLCGITNIQLKKGDVGKDLSEKNLDLITLDVPHPWEVLEKAEKNLKVGGYLVVYLTNLMQVKQFVDAARNSTIHVNEVTELIEREWKVIGNIVRPEYTPMAYTGFLVFCRRLG